MSDEQQEPSFEEELINRLANRLGIATAQVDALRLRLERAQRRIAELEEQLNPPMPEFVAPVQFDDHFQDAYQGGVPV